MKLRNQKILIPDFLPAFSELMKLKMPAKQCLEVSASLDELVNQHAIAARARRSKVVSYGMKDDKGEVCIDDKGHIRFDSEDTKQKCFQEIEELENEEFDISLSKPVKIKGDELSTPEKIRLLEELIEIVDIESASTEV